MKLKFLLPTVLFIVCVLIVITIYIPFDTRWSDSIQALAVSSALIISGVALFYSKREYEHNKKSGKTTLLCQYLHRYATDPCVKKVEDYILEMALLDERENIIGFDKSKSPSSKPTVWEKEMYMHFFEEIQLHIDDNMIDKDVVIDLIGYYIGIFHRIEEYHADVTDYNEEKWWKYYLKFVRSIPDSFYKDQGLNRDNRQLK